MKLITLLLKMVAKPVSPYASMDSSMFRCGLLLTSMMAQLQVGCVNMYVTNVYAYNYRHFTKLMTNLFTYY